MNVKYGADVIKTCATGGVFSLNDDVQSSQLTQDELNAIVDQAHSMGKKTAAHAHGIQGAKRAIQADIDSIEHGSFLDEEALDMMKAKGTYYIPTLMACVRLRENMDRYDPMQARKAKMALSSIISPAYEKIQASDVILHTASGQDSWVYPGKAGDVILISHFDRNIEAAAKGLSKIDEAVHLFAAHQAAVHAGERCSERGASLAHQLA